MTKVTVKEVMVAQLVEAIEMAGIQDAAKPAKWLGDTVSLSGQYSAGKSSVYAEVVVQALKLLAEQLARVDKQLFSSLRENCELRTDNERLTDQFDMARRRSASATARVAEVLGQLEEARADAEGYKIAQVDAVGAVLQLEKDHARALIQINNNRENHQREKARLVADLEEVRLSQTREAIEVGRLTELLALADRRVEEGFEDMAVMTVECAEAVVEVKAAAFDLLRTAM